MGRVRNMHHCSSCDVYVGRCPGGELVVVTSEFFQSCWAGHGTWNDPNFEEVWDASRWQKGANLDNGSAWFEHEEIEHLWWYQARGLKELHDHSLWLELVSR
jgi:hypothetical protein